MHPKENSLKDLRRKFWTKKEGIELTANFIHFAVEAVELHEERHQGLAFDFDLNKWRLQVIMDELLILFQMHIYLNFPQEPKMQET
jgi:hypothetical protein